MKEQEPAPVDTANMPQNGHAAPQVISSTMTLFWRVFVPVFGTFFLTGFMLAFLLLPEEELYVPFVPVSAARILAAIIWLGWLITVYRTVWRLKRVDADDVFVYVTNYWTTARYAWTDVERIESTRRMGRELAHLHLRAPGRFGKTISFLQGTHFKDWMQEHQKQVR